MNRRHLLGIAGLLTLLIVSMPFTAAATYSLTYDANGNLVTGDGKYRVYDSFNHLAKLYNGSDTTGTLLQEYLYHPAEDRILLKRTYNSTGSVIETITYVSDEFLRVTNTSGTYNTTYIMANDHQIAQILPDGSTQYLLTDVEGSVTVTTNSTGNVTERTTYTPYGDVFGGGNRTRFNYEGREADAVAGDTDFRFRKYRPEWGLFTQPDDIIQNVYDPQSLNRYSFERNNPSKYTDPDGHNPLLFLGAGAFEAGAAWYWFTTPIDYSNPQWGNRFLKGVGHGAVTSAVTLLTLPLGASGGAIRIAGPSWSLAGKGAVAGVGAEFWTATIDNRQTTPGQVAIAGVTGGASTLIPGTAGTGQYAATVNAFTKQNYKMLVDIYAEMIGEELLDKILTSASASEAINVAAHGSGGSSQQNGRAGSGTASRGGNRGSGGSGSSSGSWTGGTGAGTRHSLSRNGR